uniref:Uncharacterized protein n=1 Tax=Vespula pensylvanica TaxID=30213 RepID=A0A834JNI8_VESPE|nr:hypothetical protein H0235_017112 [Vespula pensylvanica]
MPGVFAQRLVVSISSSTVSLDSTHELSPLLVRFIDLREVGNSLTSSWDSYRQTSRPVAPEEAAAFHVSLITRPGSITDIR